MVAILNKLFLLLPLLWSSCCLLSSETQAQIKLSEVKTQTWVGFENPSVQNGVVIAGMASKPSLSSTNYVIVLEKAVEYKWTEIEAESTPDLEVIELEEVSVSPLKSELRFPQTAKPGKYRVVVRCSDPVNGPASKRLSVTLGVKPDDPTPTPPTPTPDGVNPFNMPGFRVMIVYESRDGVPRQYTGDVRAYLDSKCVKDQKTGIPQRLIIDQNSSFAPDAELWQKVMARGQKSLPWIVIGNEANGYEGPLPSSAAGVLELLKKYGG